MQTRAGMRRRRATTARVDSHNLAFGRRNCRPIEGAGVVAAAGSGSNPGRDRPLPWHPKLEGIVYDGDHLDCRFAWQSGQAADDSDAVVAQSVDGGIRVAWLDLIR